MKLFKYLLVFVIIGGWVFSGWVELWPTASSLLQIPRAQAASTTNGTTWFLSSTTASTAFGTTGPTSENSSDSDLVSGSPANKTTALAMTDTVGSSQTSVAGAETSASAGNIWFRTFLSPKLAAQTISTGTTFRAEVGAKESAAGMNAFLRINVYVWREGTGLVATLTDGVSGTNCPNTEFATSENGKICMSAATGSDQALQAGDQIALEIWVQANNISTTSFTATLYFEGNGFLQQATATSNALAAFSISQTLTLQTNAAPTLSISQPDGSSDTVTVGDSYNITYTLADSDDVVTAAFYYDSDNSGLNGAVISGACASAAEGSGVTCSWDTTSVTPGRYYVYGITNDGVNSQVSAYSSGQITINPTGSLSVDIVDSGGTSVGSPSVTFGAATFSFSPATTTATFGTSSEKIRINNTTAIAGWTLTAAATSTLAVWYGGAAGTYDFNDPGYSQDGSDTDNLGGRLSVDPSGGTITPQGGCNTTGVSKGSAIAFSEGATDSVTLLSADGTAGTSCYWDFTGIDLTQSLPAQQAVGTYNFQLILTVN